MCLLQAAKSHSISQLDHRLTLSTLVRRRLDAKRYWSGQNSRAGITMVQSAKDSPGCDPPARVWPWQVIVTGDALMDALVWPILIEVSRVFPDHLL